jgi:DNA-directed RNA polymerase specialized sigma24 family protein
VAPTPQGFLDGLRSALALPQDEDPLVSLADTGDLCRRVLFIDTYETIEPLDGWIRQVFLPGLSDNTLVVLAGRQPLPAAWRSDGAWQGLLRSVSLRNLNSEESRAYLSNRSIPLEQQPTVLRLTYGYPLALSLVADVFTQRKNRKNTSSTHPVPLMDSLDSEILPAQITPDIIEALLERFITNVPSLRHRAALEVCALVRVTDEAILAQMLTTLEDNANSSSGNGHPNDGDCHALFQWLRNLSFMEKEKQGVFPHDIVRDVLLSDLHWRNKDRYAELHHAAREFYSKHLPQAKGSEQQRLLYDCIFLHRDNAVIRTAFTWQESGSVFSDRLRDADIPGLVAMVGRHEGEEAARIAREWFLRQPEATVVLREQGEETITGADLGDGEPPGLAEPAGFLTMLALENAAASAHVADPALSAVYRYLASSPAPLRPGEEMRYLRFWMARDTYQEVSPIQSLVIVQAFRHFLASGVRVALTFFACRDPKFWEPVLEYVDIQRIESADFTLGDDSGIRYGVFGHDWRQMPTTEWLDRLSLRATAGVEAAPQEDIRRRAPVIVLSEDDFAVAVREALRHYAEPAELTANPLLQSRVVVSLSGPEADITTRAAVLRQLIQELAESLRSSPRTARSYHALHRTYLVPARTQEQAAELLDLPMSTYRRHLAEGIQALQQLLWAKETMI